MVESTCATVAHMGLPAAVEASARVLKNLQSKAGQEGGWGYGGFYGKQWAAKRVLCRDYALREIGNAGGSCYGMRSCACTYDSAWLKKLSSQRSL